MDGSNLSFIPKKSLTAPVSKERGESFLLSLSVIVLIISLLSYGGVFVYQGSLKAQIDQNTKKLDEMKGQLDPETVKGINRVAQRIEALKEIMANHRSVVGFFRLLGDNTLKTIRYSNFLYSGVGDSPIVTLQGTAKSFGSISLQSQQLGLIPNISNVLFSGFSLKDGGVVGFTAKITADPQLFAYKPNQEAK
jgi:hypothetical protein